MKRLISSLVFAFTMSTVSVSFAQNSPAVKDKDVVPAGNSSDTLDVLHVIDAYHGAVLTHDVARLADLFLPQGGMWLNDLSDDAYAHAKLNSSDAVKIRVGSYTDFAKLVSNSKANFNPTHTHLQKNSDGTIASVYFDFVFLVDGKEQNRGSESWVLVKGSDRWKIAAITYSSNPHTS